MKKITAGLIVAFAALSSTTVLAETPTVREFESFDRIVSVANKNREAKSSEFVIYHHQDGKPCAHKKGKEDKKHEGKHHKHEGKKAAAHHHKKAADAKAKAAPAAAPAKTDDTAK